MGQQIKVLLTGETWITYAIHQKGFNAFTTGTYEEGSGPLIKSLLDKGVNVSTLSNHEAANKFPSSIEEMDNFDVILLSDIGSDTLRLHPDTFLHSKPTPDRLKLLKEYVQRGGGFAMIGGYLSFQGYGGSAHYHFTPVEEILPVEMYEGDDRIELPSGFNPKVIKDHQITNNLPKEWPMLLGYNKVKSIGEVLVAAEGDDPLLVIGEYAKGRTAAFTSDCSPHWGSPEFVSWEHYGSFWSNFVRWLAGK